MYQSLEMSQFFGVLQFVIVCLFAGTLANSSNRFKEGDFDKMALAHAVNHHFFWGRLVAFGHLVIIACGFALLFPTVAMLIKFELGWIERDLVVIAMGCAIRWLVHRSFAFQLWAAKTYCRSAVAI